MLETDELGHSIRVGVGLQECGTDILVPYGSSWFPAAHESESHCMELYHIRVVREIISICYLLILSKTLLHTTDFVLSTAFDVKQQTSWCSFLHCSGKLGIPRKDWRENPLLE